MSVTVAFARDLARLTDEQLLQIHYEERDVAAREELVERFMPFARKLAHRYMHTTEPMPDLVQVACDRIAERHRSVRARPGQAIHGLRGADDPRRTEAAFSG